MKARSDERQHPQRRSRWSRLPLAGTDCQHWWTAGGRALRIRRRMEVHLRAGMAGVRGPVRAFSGIAAVARANPGRKLAAYGAVVLRKPPAGGATAPTDGDRKSVV